MSTNYHPLWDGSLSAWDSATDELVVQAMLNPPRRPEPEISAYLRQKRRPCVRLWSFLNRTDANWATAKRSPEDKQPN